jgi:hypothetical protein
MPDKEKKPEFVVTDRRKFTPEGERRADEVTESQPAAPKAKQTETPSPAVSAAAEPQQVPPPPSAAEQQAQKDAYRKSTGDVDARIRQQLGERSPQDLQITFERFVASLYMSALMQLGLLREESGRPQVDIIGARQTIDTIELLSDKTKGNLTSAEENFLQNCLYELRMAYVEVTNAISRGPQPPEAAGKR